jgi:hypothetical protein
VIASSDRAAIRAAVRARIAAAFPGATDITDAPHPVAAELLPAFSVRSERVSAETLAMGGATGRRLSDRVTVQWLAAGGAELGATLDAAAGDVADAVLGPPADLGDIAMEVSPIGVDIAVEDGERRVGRADVAFVIDYLG